MELLKEHATSNAPLRGYKGQLVEGGVRTIGFVHSPLMKPELRGNSYPKLMDISDWLPTMLDLGRCKEDQTRQGWKILIQSMFRSVDIKIVDMFKRVDISPTSQKAPHLNMDCLSSAIPICKNAYEICIIYL